MALKTDLVEKYPSFPSFLSRYTPFLSFESFSNGIPECTFFAASEVVLYLALGWEDSRLNLSSFLDYSALLTAEQMLDRAVTP